MTRKQVEEEYKKLMEEIEGLNKINEEHKKLNGELRKEIDGLVTVIDLAKNYIKSNEEEYGSLEDNEKIILEILERVNEE